MSLESESRTESTASSESTSTSPSVRWARWVVRWRWPVLFASVALIFAAGAGAKKLGFNDEYRVFFGPDNPQLLAFDAVEAIYTKNDNIFFVIEPPGDDAFDTESLEVVERLTDDAWKIPFSIRVDSVSNFQHSWADGDDVIVEDLIQGASALDAEGRCCTARSKTLTSLCRSLSHPAQYVSGIPSPVILLTISHPIRCSTRCLANVRVRISSPMIAL